MKSTNYSEKVLDHFRNPRNVGTLIGDDVSYGRVGNPVCGDLMDIYIKVNNDIIEDIRFQTFGCGSAVATSSMITEMVKGKTLDDAYKTTRKDVAEELDGLPPIKMHCSNLAADALKAAIDNYRAGVRVGTKLPEEPIIDQKGCASIEIAESLVQSIGTKVQITGLEEYSGKGVHFRIENFSEFEDLRTLMVFNGDNSIKKAIKLTDYTNRVILMTKDTSIKTNDAELKRELKISDVKTLYQSELIEIGGEGEVEKVKIHDLDEDDKYELFIDAIVILRDN